MTTENYQLPMGDNRRHFCKNWATIRISLLLAAVSYDLGDSLFLLHRCTWCSPEIILFGGVYFEQKTKFHPNSVIMARIKITISTGREDKSSLNSLHGLSSSIFPSRIILRNCNSFSSSVSSVPSLIMFQKSIWPFMIAISSGDLSPWAT